MDSIIPNIVETEDGSHTVWSEKYQVTYHSRYGAVQESQHVFIDAGLRWKAAIQQQISILEVGMGTGLNVFMTHLEAKRRNLTINYTALEAYPIALEKINSFNFVTILKAKEDEAIFQKIHRCDWGKKQKLGTDFRFIKILDKVENWSSPPQFDLIYFDAFAPDSQPELWQDDTLQKMYDSLLPDGILVTYCAKGDVKRTLKRVGFSLESIPGPPRKREMTRASR